MKDLITLLKKNKHEIKQHVKSLTTIHSNEWYYKPGKKICFVAHIDKIGDNEIPNIIIEDNIIRTDGTTCLGGDDRVGIYIIEYLLKQNPDIGVLFTDFEESGGIGAKSFCEEYDGNFEYETLIQVDRAGINHYVNYHPISKQLEIYLNNIGLKRGHGSFSDISILSPYFDIDAINIACGYYKEHTCNEFININDVDICISFCQTVQHYNGVTNV